MGLRPVARFLKSWDGTHIPKSRVQLIASSSTDVSGCRWPGKIHDSQTFANEKSITVARIVLGDSAYSFVMKPYTENITTILEKLFNYRPQIPFEKWAKFTFKRLGCSYSLILCTLQHVHL